MHPEERETSEKEIPWEKIQGEELFEQKSTTWPVRCSPAQKEFLQRLCAQSGMSVAEFLVFATKESAQKNKESSEVHQELSEVDSLLDRLTRLMKAKVYVACEQQQQLKEQREEITLYRSRVESEIEIHQSSFEEEIKEKRALLSQEYEIKFQNFKEQQKQEREAWEKQSVKQKEENGDLQEKLALKQQELTQRDKQYHESLRWFDRVEEENKLLKNQVLEYKEEMGVLKKNVEMLKYLEKQNEELKHNQAFAQLKHDEELKRLNSEFDLKIKIVEHEVEKRYRLEQNM